MTLRAAVAKLMISLSGRECCERVSSKCSFALRALCHRGRATPTSDTPEAFTLLVYAPSCRPKTRAAWRRAPAGLPDPIAQLVCQFWLGNPPHRYRRAVPAGE